MSVQNDTTASVIVAVLVTSAIFAVVNTLKTEEFTFFEAPNTHSLEVCTNARAEYNEATDETKGN